jgi:putative flippase GtrA
VSLVSTLYQRFRLLIHEGSKFLVIGGIGFLVTEGIFNAMIAGHQASFTANVVSTMLAAAVTFAGNRYWTFRHRERTGMGRETVVFFALNLVGIVIQQACLEIAKHGVGRNDKLTVNIAFLVGVALATLFRFWSYRRFVWLAQSPAVAGDAPAERHEEREPALVPPEPFVGYGGPNGNGAGPYQSGQGQPDGPRRARSS